MEGEKTPGYSLLLRNLRYTTTAQLVRESFEQFGNIRDVYLPLDFATKRPRGFGFVEFEQEEDAIEAVKAMDNTELDGSVITCCMAQDRRKSPNSMRRAYNNNSGGGGGSKRVDYYGRPRSRSRSHDARYARRSVSHGRRYPPPRDEPPYYHRRDHERSPPRYGRPYPPPRDYRDHRDHRGGDYYDREPRRYPDRPHHADYARSPHDRRRSPPRGHETHDLEPMAPESHDIRGRRPPRKN